MEGKTGNLDGMGVENTEQAERNKLSKKSSRFLIVLPFLLPLFLKAGAGTVCFISALAEQQYQLNSETTVNPFFQGSVTFISNSESSKVYCQEEKKYIDASSFYTVNSVFDRKGHLLLAYSTDNEAPRSLRKTPFIKTIINQGMSRRSGGSVSDVEDPYINVSEIFEQFFDRKLNYSVDEEKKIIRLIL